MSDREREDVRAELHAVTGRLNHLLERFGDDLAAREGYRTHTGFDAVRFFLMQKHGWLPRGVLNMSPEDLRFAMAEEMHGWTVPKGFKTPA